jgi:hypothetical protein
MQLFPQVKYFAGQLGDAFGIRILTVHQGILFSPFDGYFLANCDGFAQKLIPGGNGFVIQLPCLITGARAKVISGLAPARAASPGAGIDRPHAGQGKCADQDRSQDDFFVQRLFGHSCISLG